MRLALWEAEEVGRAFAKQLRFAVETLSNLRPIYARASPEVRREILVRTFPGGLVFDGSKFRTAEEETIIGLLSGKSQVFEQEKAPEVGPVLFGSPFRAIIEPLQR